MTKAQRKAARAAQRRQNKKQGQKYPVAAVMSCGHYSKRALSPQTTIPTQSNSTHNSQAYGADVMRMWCATADYSKDVTVRRHTRFSHVIAR